MISRQQDEYSGNLKARFTGWMEVTLYRARVDYLRRLKKDPAVTSRASFPERMMVEEDAEDAWLQEIAGKDSFLFSDERLERCFDSLPLVQQEILVMLYVREMEPKEAAKSKGISLGHAYRLKKTALAHLSAMLEEGGEERA